MINSISGGLIFLSFLFTNFSYFFNDKLLVLAGIFAWISFFFLFITLPKKKIIIPLLILSFCNFLFSYINGFEIDFIKAIIVNQYLLALLIGVSLLKLITTPKFEKNAQRESGRSSFFKTYLGIHLFGSVINLSSLVLVADKMYKKAPLTNLQLVVLTRAFSSDAYWSPFFVSFAVALTYLPDFDKATIFFNGISLAIIAFIITYFEVKKKFDMENFKGYPISLETLYIPVILALMVLFSKYYDENLKVIVLISSYSLILTFIILCIKEKFRKVFYLLKEHIVSDLPNMKMEISLFIVAGMFGVSVSSILTGYNVIFPLSEFTYIEASLVLLGFIFLSFVGIHPIITIAVISDFLIQFNHTLLAVTFLMAWATTVSTSPFSGLSLTIQARYNINAKQIFVLNIPYAIKMYLVCVLILYILDNFIV
ncbi:tellurium resistance protein TerC [Arcobacter sp.]|uniref:tellurium resistance protein TerC n=1 Tax=Arcobacter sp. TaxID=1872629 RepID=UPI003D0A11DA